MDLGFFILMGIVGGLLGATFNCLNKRLAKYRMRNVHPKPKLVRYVCSIESVQGSHSQSKSINLEDLVSRIGGNLRLVILKITK